MTICPYGPSASWNTQREQPRIHRARRPPLPRAAGRRALAVRLLLCAGTAWLILHAAAAHAAEPAGIERVGILACETLPNGKTGLRIDMSTAGYDASALVLVARGMTPLGWARPADPPSHSSEPHRSETRSATQSAHPPAATHAQTPNFVANFTLREIDTPEKLRAWLIRPRLFAELAPNWPQHAPLTTVIDSIGPGQRHAWLVGGAERGWLRGQSWWLRLAGQPVARFDTRYTGPGLSYCSVTPLVADAPLSPGQCVEAWPSPGERKNGRVTSAVVFTEDIGSDQRVWIAAPPDVGFPREPRIDFMRAGRYVGRGVVESRDPAFWYVRVSARACLERIMVGDDAQVRTLTMIHRREFVAHVFETAPEGYLIDVGEAENIAVDQFATAWRDGRALGTVIVSRVQNDYAFVRRPPDPPGEPLQRGDEVHFAPRGGNTEPRVVGEIDDVVDGTIFTARMRTDRKPSARIPLAVRSGTRTVGAALLIDVADSVGFGFVIGEPQAVSPERGALLVEDGGQGP